MDQGKVASRQEWLAARLELLDKEKEFTRLRDELSERRRALPRVRLEKEYVFDGPEGKRTLEELFAGRSQLIVYHFMFDPDWDEGCPNCSFWADGFDGAPQHLAHRDATMVLISRAPIEKLIAYRTRMGWRIPWFSSSGNEFNFDFGASFTEDGGGTYNFRDHHGRGEAPGLSVFLKADDGSIYHTYSCYARGLDMINVTYQLLDLTPKGRDEDGLPWPMDWVRRHDAYDR